MFRIVNIHGTVGDFWTVLFHNSRLKCACSEKGLLLQSPIIKKYTISHMWKLQLKYLQRKQQKLSHYVHVECIHNWQSDMYRPHLWLQQGWMDTDRSPRNDSCMNHFSDSNIFITSELPNYIILFWTYYY